MAQRRVIPDEALADAKAAPPTLQEAISVILAQLVPRLVSLLAPQPHPFEGRYVVCRCTMAGVHAGVLVTQVGQNVLLHDSRRLWSWEANSGSALSGVAMSGLKAGGANNLDTRLPEIQLTDVIETIPCTSAARASIDGYR